MELERLEIEAKLDALEEIKEFLNKPGNLDKIDRYKTRTTQKKALLESQLKTAMQNQLDGIRVGQKQLLNSSKETKDVDSL